MPMFAVYYVPPADSDIYQAGSEILGYDLYRKEVLSVDNSTRSRLPSFDKRWVSEAQQYGFHATIGHAIEYNENRLPEIEQEIEHILNLFDPTQPMILTPNSDPIQQHGEQVFALRYNPNQMLMMFHALIIARLHPMGLTTPLHEEWKNRNHSNLKQYQQHCIAQYFRPDLLGDWQPHFTLINPYDGNNHADMLNRLKAIFTNMKPLVINNFALLLKPDGADHFYIHREYNRINYPQVI